MSLWKDFTTGIIRENPVIVLMIGLCPALAVSSSANDAFGMSIAVLFVLLASNIIVSLIRHHIPDSIRIPIFIVIISTFVTAVDYIIHAFDMELYASLGVFIPLIVVNCIILGRAEAYAYKNNVFSSALDGLGMAFGFMLTMVILGGIREIIGNGTFTILNYQFINLGEGYNPALVFIMPPGAFLTIAFMMAAHRKWLKK
ncbi:MAG TPA: RnfABCDGE type electron transport complex subunit E [Nitrospirota bacterium]|nr:RnfABCDGE type electron transport complex subunit E [Nitrospirota bacterium]